MVYLRECIHHGLTEFSGGTKQRCKRCRVRDTANQRKKNKAILIAEHGGACKECGYSKSNRALTFHHRDPSQKRFAISSNRYSASIAKLREEAAKCDLLCFNCHMEKEDELR